MKSTDLERKSDIKENKESEEDAKKDLGPTDVAPIDVDEALKRCVIKGIFNFDMNDSQVHIQQ